MASIEKSAEKTLPLYRYQGWERSTLGMNERVGHHGLPRRRKINGWIE